MDEEKALTSSATDLMESQEKALEPAEPESPAPRRRMIIPSLWILLSTIIIVGVVILVVVSSVAGYWIQNIQLGINQSPTPLPVTTLDVQRTALYAGLDMTVISAQYAPVFPDDNIHLGPATLRLNMRVANHSGEQARVLYYNIAYLLIPAQKSILPSNVYLSDGPQPGKSETGWIDFAVPKGLNLDTLALQLGSTVTNEALVTIPFKGAFDPGRYANKVSHPNATIYYYYYGHPLIYHLRSVEVRYAYQGVQCKTGQQFYVLNFQVDNGSGQDVTPGFGFDYMRLVVNGYSQPPIDNTLPATFKNGARGVSGRVVFAAPAGMRTLTIGFLPQTGGAQLNTDVGI
ncbi:MAG TPA: hypothetical protein VKY19_17125 [Ktedonosporobacter sp.]|jgi:hypothetical protein|nr:hypothetical protein [Ktedonosporobacter sp.]